MSTTSVLLLGYQKNRTAYVIQPNDHEIYVNVDDPPSATRGFYLAAGASMVAFLNEGMDTRMPVYAIRAGSTDAVVSIRADFQEEPTEYEGV